MAFRYMVGSGINAKRADMTWVLFAAALAGTAATLGSAQARTVQFPEHRPEVSLDVPDDWSVTYTSAGLELRSPEKNSVVVANLFKGKKETDSWLLQAKQTLAEAGVATVETAARTPPAVAPVAAQLPGAVPTLAAPSGTPFTFSGAPAVNMAGGLPPVSGTEASKFAAPFGTAPAAATSRNKIPHRIVNYKDATFGGKPTDVQLYIFSLTHDDLFLIEQQSGQSDNRAVDIVYSVKRAH